MWVDQILVTLHFPFVYKLILERLNQMNSAGDVKVAYNQSAIGSICNAPLFREMKHLGGHYDVGDTKRMYIRV